MEAKEIINFLGLELEDPDNATIDDLKEQFHQKFTTYEDAKQDAEIGKHHVGKRMGSATRELIRKAKDAGVEFEDGELKDDNGNELPVEELGKKTIDKINKGYEEKIKELKESKSKTDDKKAQDLEKRLEEANKQWNEDKQMLEETKQELEKERQDKQNQIKNFKINDQLSKIKKGVNFVDDMKPVHEKGLHQELNEKYQFDLNENDELVVTDKEGNRLKSKEKAGEYLQPQDVIQQVAHENGLLKENNGGDKGGGQPTPAQPSGGQSNGQPTNGRKVHPAAAG